MHSAAQRIFNYTRNSVGLVFPFCLGANQGRFWSGAAAAFGRRIGWGWRNGLEMMEAVGPWMGIPKEGRDPVDGGWLAWSYEQGRRYQPALLPKRRGSEMGFSSHRPRPKDGGERRRHRGQADSGPRGAWFIQHTTDDEVLLVFFSFRCFLLWSCCFSSDKKVPAPSRWFFFREGGPSSSLLSSSSYHLSCLGRP